jgi:hypothetical protein
MDFKSKEGEPVEDGQWRIRVLLSRRNYLASGGKMKKSDQKKEMRC